MKFPEVSMETRKVVTRNMTLVLKECHVIEIIKQWAILNRGFTRPVIEIESAIGYIEGVEITETEEKEL